jgi:hypothetical protein
VYAHTAANFGLISTFWHYYSPKKTGLKALKIALSVWPQITWHNLTLYCDQLTSFGHTLENKVKS